MNDLSWVVTCWRVKALKSPKHFTTGKLDLTGAVSQKEKSKIVLENKQDDPSRAFARLDTKQKYYLLIPSHLNANMKLILLIITAIFGVANQYRELVLFQPEIFNNNNNIVICFFRTSNKK